MSDVPPPPPPAGGPAAPVPGATPPAATPAPVAAPVAPEPEKTGKPSVLGWIALGTAAVGFIFACIPGALIVGWVLLPIAFILGIVALFMKGRKWPAIVAVIVSIVGTIIGVVVFMSVVSAAFEDSFGGGDSSVTEPNESTDDEAEAADEVEEEPAAEVGSRENPAALGSTISGDDYDVIVNSFTANATDQVMAANAFNEDPPAGSEYAIVSLTITYTGDESGFAAFVGVDWVTSTGEVITQSETLAVAPDPALGLDELYNGGTATGNIVLAIPTGNDGLLRIRPGMLADEVFVAVQ